MFLLKSVVETKINENKDGQIERFDLFYIKIFISKNNIH